MASPEPGAYHHHHLYSHQDQRQPPPSMPSPHNHVYSERPHHYPDHHHHTDNHPPLSSHPPDLEQPLDLSVSRSPRPASAGSLLGFEASAKRPRLDDPALEADVSRGGHSGLCMMRGCSCHSTMPLHHNHHHHSQYNRHRHSPYPQYPVPGHASPTQGGMQPYLQPYPLPHPPPSSSPAMMYGSRASSYIPPPAPDTRPSRSPALVSTYSSEALHHSPAPLLSPPSHTSVSPLPVSPRPQEPSPCPPGQSAPRARDVSPRPLFRPYGDLNPPPAEVSHSGLGFGNRMAAMELYPSEDDLSASSTLLMLSTAPSESTTSSSAICHTADSSMEDYRQQGEAMSITDTDGALAESPHSETVKQDTGHQLPPHPSSPRPTQATPTASAGHPGEESPEEPTHKDSQQLGPAQDDTVASSFPSDDLTESASPDQSESKNKSLESRFVKVIGTTPLAALREERAKRQASASKGRMKELIIRRHGCHTANSNDSEGGSDQNSSGQPSPRSIDGSENDVAQGFPIPPDPNIKMSALDYLITKVLVERIDVPFKACNTEIKEIYTGAKKGRLTLVDLIELQVEASLKA